VDEKTKKIRPGMGRKKGEKAPQRDSNLPTFSIQHPTISVALLPEFQGRFRDLQGRLCLDESALVDERLPFALERRERDGRLEISGKLLFELFLFDLAIQHLRGEL
jgi:hypothetical protein